jgi:hypothetical protein
MIMHKKPYKIAWFVSIGIFTAMACSLVTGLTEDIQGARGTVGAAATQVKAISSQAQSFASTLEESGTLKTARAVATKEGSKLLSTAKALATEAEERGVIKTAQAYTTQEGGNLLSTAEAMATQGVRAGSAPADIPVVNEDTIVNFLGSPQLVSYLTSVSLSQVVEFYKLEMPANGWDTIQQGNVVTDQVARLRFEKPEKTADITININPLDQKTLVTVIIRGSE